MGGTWLGRRDWLWLVDGGLVVFGIVLFLIGDDVTRIAAVFIVTMRLLFAGIQVLVWKRTQASHDRTSPPR